MCFSLSLFISAEIQRNKWTGEWRKRQNEIVIDWQIFAYWLIIHAIAKKKKISNQLVIGMFMLNVFSRQVFEMLLKVTSNVFAITNIPSKIRIISINLKSICFFISLLASHTFTVQTNKKLFCTKSYKMNAYI